MTKREVRKSLYKDNDRTLFFKLAIFFRIYSVRPVGKTKLLKLSTGSYTVYYFDERYNLYNPLTWLDILVSMILGIIALFITDFLIPLVEAIISVPRDLKHAQQWRRRVLNKEVYNEVLENE